MRDWRMGAWFAERLGYLVVGMVLAGWLDRVEWTTRQASFESAQEHAIAEFTETRQALDAMTGSVSTALAGMQRSLHDQERSVDRLSTESQLAFSTLTTFLQDTLTPEEQERVAVRHRLRALEAKAQ